MPRSPLRYQFNFHLVTAADPPGRDQLNPNFVGLLETVYDTWTPTYESDGINQAPSTSDGFVVAVLDGLGNSNTQVDRGTDGVDNDGVNGPDDFGERETQPPYNHPIRGLQVTFRLVEKQTGQVRQSSIVHNYGAQ